MGLGIPPIKLRSCLSKNPPKSRILLRRSAAGPPTAQRLPPTPECLGHRRSLPTWFLPTVMGPVDCNHYKCDHNLFSEPNTCQSPRPPPAAGASAAARLSQPPPRRTRPGPAAGRGPRAAPGGVVAWTKQEDAVGECPAARGWPFSGLQPALPHRWALSSF